MRLAALATVASLLVLVAPPLESQQDGASGTPVRIPMPVALDTTGLFQAAFASVGEDLFIAGQPTEAALRALARRGVTTVVNLRTPREMQNRRAVPFDEEALVRELGMRYVYLPVRGDREHPFTPATVDAFASALQEAEGKVLLHCTIAWRASHLWSAFLIRERGLPVDEALAHGRAINLAWRAATSGREPVEEFLDRDLPALRRDSQR